MLDYIVDDIDSSWYFHQPGQSIGLNMLLVLQTLSYNITGELSQASVIVKTLPTAFTYIQILMCRFFHICVKLSFCKLLKLPQPPPMITVGTNVLPKISAIFLLPEKV